MNIDGILSTLNQHQVRYILIGGVNFLLNHKPVLTFDLDIWIEDSLENHSHLLQALIEMEAEWGPREESWKKGRDMKWYLCAALCAGALAMMEMNAYGNEEPVLVRVDPSTVICQRFIGFGVEWDSNGYNDNNVTDTDFAVIRKRIEWMRLSIARIMMQTN